MTESGRHPESWIAQFKLAFAIVSLPAALYWLASVQPDTLGGYTASPGLSWWVAVSILAVGIGLWLAGVIWMIRILRGPKNKRYHVR